MAESIVYHRSPEFQPVLRRVLDRLPAVFRTSGEVAVFTASGSGALESAVANLVSAGERVFVVSAGYFGERWAQILEHYGADIAHARYAWGETPEPEHVAQELRRSGATIVYCTHCETSTGVVADVSALAEAAREAGALCVVDAVSSLGAVPLEQAEWGIDVVVSGSQKALMTPPGLSFASVSERALERSARATSPRFYFDWEKTLRTQRETRTAFTPSVPLVRGLDVALGLLLEEGIEAAWESSRQLGAFCRETVKAMGLELFSPDEDRSAVVTAIRIPDGVDGAAIVRAMRERHGITVAGGQGELRGKIVRIGHIGHIGRDDVVAALAALGDSLVAAGVPLERAVTVSQ
jgi:aspartate aminotransferase-like enzyme